jgi:hypothetical protein
MFIILQCDVSLKLKKKKKKNMQHSRPSAFANRLDNRRTWMNYLREQLHIKAGLPEFSLFNISKRGEIYQNDGKYTKTTGNIPKRVETYQ